MDKIATMLNATEESAEHPDVFPIRVLLQKARDLVADIHSYKPQLMDIRLPENKREELEVKSVTAQAQVEGLVNLTEGVYKKWR